VTVNAEFPYIQFLGNGVSVDFPFSWSSGDPSEMYVKLDGTLLTEGVEYELTDFTLEFGGTMLFNAAPDAGEVVYIYRDTPVTQQLDYVDGEPFPTDTHEFQLDKDTRILQEIIEGGRAIGGRVDLSAIQWEETVEITNTSGSNAIINTWTTDGLLAGVSIGEVILNGDPTPVDGNPTDKKDGYIWWYLGPAPTAGGDVQIVMYTAPIAVNTTTTAPDVARAEFRYSGTTGDIEYGYDPQQPLVEPVWTTEKGINPAPTAPNQYWIKFTVITGTVNEQTSSPIDTWIDAANIAGYPSPFVGWYVLDGESVTAQITAAPDDGGGTPDEDFAISRYVTMSATQI